MTDVDLQPGIDVVLQEEPPELTTIPVCVKDVHGPVRTQALPRKSATSRTVSLGTTAQQLLFANHWRAKAVIMSMDQSIVFAFSQASAQDLSTMSVWPKGVPLVVEATVELWVAAVTATTAVSVTTELWATGD